MRLYSTISINTTRNILSNWWKQLYKRNSKIFIKYLLLQTQLKQEKYTNISTECKSVI